MPATKVNVMAATVGRVGEPFFSDRSRDNRSQPEKNGRRGRVGSKSPTMHVATALTVFVVIFPAELPDKTLVASLILGTRFPPLPTWCGVAAAFVVQCTVAVLAGGIFSLLPHRLVEVVAAVMFGIGSWVLWREKPEEEETVAETAAMAASPQTTKILATSFAVVFVAEWGDVTQILTAALAAKYHDPVSVFTGSLLALWSVAAIGIVAGRNLLKVVPLRVVQRVAAGLFATLALVTLVSVVIG
jgi:putative Ca2+/H+ antiporter (TMEM165/GDT1 family)